MKKTALIIGIAAAAVAAVSCTKDVNPQQGKRQTVLSAVIPDTKVTFQDLSEGVFPLKWDDTGESVRAYCRADGSSWVTSTNSTSVSVSEDGKKASFSIDLPETEAADRDVYIVSPAASGYQILAANRTDYLDIIRLDSKYTPQVPKAGSPDSRFVLMVSKHENLSAYPSSVALDFAIVESFGRMTVKGLDASSVSNIRIAFPDRTHVTGFLDYKISTDECILTKASSSANYIDVNPKNLTVGSADFDVWFGIAPQTFAEGESVKFTFTTPDGDFVKETTIPTGKTLAFEKGKVTGFAVDMSGVSFKKSKTLNFDFSTNTGSLAGNAWTGRAAKDVAYTADDKQSYTFCVGGGCFFNTNRLTLNGTNGFLGLPAIEGYKLVSIAADRTNNTGASVTLEVTAGVPGAEGSSAITGTISWTSGVAKPATISLTGTANGTMYYIHSLGSSWVPFNALTLVYE